MNIVTITGAKNSGQLDVALKLAENTAVNFVKCYTDRERNHLLWEDCYIFVSKEELDTLLDEREVLYQTVLNGDRYVFFKDQVTHEYNVLIVDDYGVVELMKYRPYFYSIKVVSSNEKPSSRVGVYLYNHEFDRLFQYGVEDIEDLEADIEANLFLADME